MKSTLKIVHRGVMNKGPASLNDLFNVYICIPNRSLRSINENLLLPPRTKFKFTENDVAHRGSQYWNKTNSETRHETNTDAYKRMLKTYGTNFMENG